VRSSHKSPQTPNKLGKTETAGEAAERPDAADEASPNDGTSLLTRVLGALQKQRR
jgi:hypothetical protein